MFWRDTQGAAAVEFGFLAPVLLLMLLATIETARAVSTDRHFTSAVATAGDLVAREEYLGKTSTAAKSNLDSMMLSIKHLMQPYDSSSLKLAVFSVRASPDQRFRHEGDLVVLVQRHEGAGRLLGLHPAIQHRRQGRQRDRR